MRRVVLASVVGLFLAVLVAVRVLGGEQKNEPPGPHIKSDSPPATAMSDSAELLQSKHDADEVIAQFVDAFYSRSSSLLQLDLEQRMKRYVSRIDPYVTQGFLDLYLYPLNTQQDKELARLGGSVRASISQYGSGHSHDSSLEKEVQVTFVTKWPDNRPQRTEISILVYMVRQDGTWRVEAFEDLSVP